MNPLDRLMQEQQRGTINPLDALNTKQNSLDALSQPQVPQQESWPSSIGHFATYLAKGLVDQVIHPVDAVTSTYNAAQAISDNTEKMHRAIIDYWNKTPILQMPGDALAKVQQGFAAAKDNITNGPSIGDRFAGVLEGGGIGTVSGLGTIPLGIAGGVMGMTALNNLLIKTPLEATLGYKNVNGEAVPMQPQEQAQAIQSTVGFIAGVAAQNYFAKGLLGTAVTRNALASVPPMGSLWKVAGANIVAGAAGGAVTGGVESLGDPDKALSAIASYALAGGTLAGVLGTTFEKSSYQNKVANVANLRVSETTARIAEMAGINETQVKLPDTYTSSLAKVEAFASADNMFTAAAKQGRTTKGGLIVEGLSPQLTSAFASTPDQPNVNMVTRVDPNTNQATSIVLDPGATLDPKFNAVFQKTGYLPNEVVTYQGSDHVVDGIRPDDKLNIRQVSNGNVLAVDADALTRKPNYSLNHLTTSVVGSDELGVQYPQLPSGQAAIGNLYSKFRTLYNLDAPIASLSYDQSIAKFIKDQNLPQQWQQPLAETFVKNIRDEVLAKAKVNDPAEVFRMQKLQDTSNDFLRNLATKQAARASSLVAINDMYMTTDGDGVYRLRFNENDNEAGTVNRLDQVESLIKTVKQTAFLDSDGGNTGAIPPAVGNGGGFMSASDPMGSNEEFLNQLRVSKPASLITPAVAQARAIDGLHGYGGKLFGVVDGLGKADNRLKYYIQENLKPAVKILMQLGNVQSKMSDEMLGQVFDAAGSISTKDYDAGILKRPPNDFERQHIGLLVNDQVNMTNIRTLLRVAAESNDNWDSAIKKVQEAGMKYSPQDLMHAQFIKHKFQLGEAQYDPAMVMNYAERVLDPSIDLSRDEYMKANNMTAEQRRMVDLNDKYYQELGTKFNVGNPSQTPRYIPHMKLYADIGYDNVNQGISPFFSEMRRLGVLDNKGSASRNVTNTAYRYLRAGAVKYSGMSNALASADDVIGQIKQDGPQHPYNRDPSIMSDQRLNQMESWYNSYRDNIVRGVPGVEDKLSKSAQNVATKLLGSAGGAAMDLLNTSLQGGMRLWLAERALLSTGVFAFTHLDGPTFADAFKKMFVDGISKEERESIFREGDLPKNISSVLFDPSADSGFRVAGGHQIADFALRMSGHPYVYSKATMAVYLAKKAEVLQKMRGVDVNDPMALKKAYSSIDLDSQGYAFSQHFDDLVQAGRLEQGAKDYGRFMSRKINNFYGQINNPIGWKGSAGRLIGAYQSYPTNAASVTHDMLMTGPLSSRAYKLAKFGTAQAALYAGGAALGVNLAGAMYNPLQWVPGVGPLLQFNNEVRQAIGGMISPDQGIRDIAEGKLKAALPWYDSNRIKTYTRPFFPFTAELNDIMQAHQAADRGKPWMMDAYIGTGGKAIKPGHNIVQNFFNQ